LIKKKRKKERKKKKLHKLITCSDNTVLRRIVEMAADVTNKTVETIMQAQQFFPLIG
jgi:hypothetical protein